MRREKLDQQAEQEIEDAKNEIVYDMLTVAGMIDAEERWAWEIDKICNALEIGHAHSPRESFLKLWEHTQSAYEGRTVRGDWDRNGPTGASLVGNKAAAPLLFFFVGCLQRFANAIRDRPGLSATELRAELALAFRVTQTGPDGQAKRGAIGGPVFYGVRDVFENALYAAAEDIPDPFRCNRLAYSAAFRYLYRRPFQETLKDREDMALLERYVQAADLAFDDDEDISEFRLMRPSK